MDKDGLGNRIKKIRIEKGLTLEEFGKLVEKANKSIVSKWERGTTVPNNSRLKRIAELGNVSISYLLEGEKKIDANQGIGKTPFEVTINTKNDQYNIKGFYFIQRDWLTLNGDYGMFLYFPFGLDSHEYVDVTKAVAIEILNNIDYPKNEKGKIPLIWVEPLEKGFKVKKFGFEI